MKQGFSLVEILIAMSILGIILVTSTQSIAASIRNMTVEEHKIYANYFAENIINWLDTEREADWKTFAAKAGTVNNTAVFYCLNDNIPPNSNADNELDPPGHCAASSYGITGLPAGANVPQIFKREVSLTPIIAGGATVQVNVTVTVSWSELNQNFSVPVSSSFTIHE